jgi:hypothetical protein
MEPLVIAKLMAFGKTWTKVCSLSIQQPCPKGEDISRQADHVLGGVQVERMIHAGRNISSSWLINLDEREYVHADKYNCALLKVLGVQK